MVRDSFFIWAFLFVLDSHPDSYSMFEGCNEIIFNPLIKWWRSGPISPQLRGFVWSKAPLHYKIGMMSCTWMQFSPVVEM